MAAGHRRYPARSPCATSINYPTYRHHAITGSPRDRHKVFGACAITCKSCHWAIGLLQALTCADADAANAVIHLPLESETDWCRILDTHRRPLRAEFAALSLP